MKVNYVLMYGIPYVRYKEFETFEDISKFLVHKGYVNYSIFKKLEDKEEIEMIYRDNDIHYLENFVKEKDKEIERLNENNQAMQEEMARTWKKIEEKENIIKEVREYIEDVLEYEGKEYTSVIRETLIKILNKGE